MGARAINPGNGQLAVRPNPTVMYLSDKGTTSNLIACPGRVKCRRSADVVHSFDRRSRVWMWHSVCGLDLEKQAQRFNRNGVLMKVQCG